MKYDREIEGVLATLSKDDEMSARRDLMLYGQFFVAVSKVCKSERIPPETIGIKKPRNVEWTRPQP